ncbi:MAG: hypothetical protein IPG32_03535 [Saprospirales bacterium]|nr:hypothetical protein [Saprospirales bacterium]
MKWRNIIFYATSIGGLFLLINLLLVRGRALEAERPISSGPSSAPIGWAALPRGDGEQRHANRSASC